MRASILWGTLCVALMGAAMSTAATAAPDNPIPPGFKVAPMSRATIIVRDQDESLKLYRDILGLRVRADKTYDDARFNQILGVKGQAIKVKILQAGDVVYGNLGLFELAGPAKPASAAPSKETGTRPGDVAVVFLTSDIDGIAAKVTAAGYTIISPPMVLFPSDTMKVQSREMLFRDRDGVLVNLIQSGEKK
jgi:catechol 2,3-dioxygenase-like lactoylglutathione lyase family enzyme